MDIVLIGSGNVATVFGRKSFAAGHRIVQVYNRHGSSAEDLAKRLGAKETAAVSSIERNADLMIIALRDEAIAPFVRMLGPVKSLVTHTAGALPINEVRGVSDRYGVLYPLQSLRKEIEAIPPLSILVDGSEPETTARLKNFATTIAETVVEADDRTRLQYHLAATFVNNFTNHLFALTASYCEKENISFAVLQSLIEETVMRLRSASPDRVQTGPAFRNDQATIDKHRHLLREYPVLLGFYNLFTEEIIKFHSIRKTY
jgi:predicted short-subunit dehydrogenase-like oxidoreductase (DUF2520 family)